MRRSAAILAAFCVFLTAPAEAQPLPFSSLVGCWHTADGVIERWAEDEGAWSGTRTSVLDNGVEFTEFLDIETRADGRMIYRDATAHAWEMTFSLTHVGPAEAIFDSLNNEPPLRVVYRLSGENLFISWYETRRPDETPSTEAFVRGCSDAPTS